jgi:formate-dependent nitrite reductase membrane component NrfD
MRIPMTTETETLQQRLRGMRWFAVWALIFGLGIGFYAGFNLGVSTAHDAAAALAPKAE